jgi:hypothetical protein
VHRERRKVPPQPPRERAADRHVRRDRGRHPCRPRRPRARRLADERLREAREGADLEAAVLLGEEMLHGIIAVLVLREGERVGDDRADERRLHAAAARGVTHGTRARWG